MKSANSFFIIYSFVRSFVRSFPRSLVRSFIRSFIHSFPHSSIYKAPFKISTLRHPQPSHGNTNQSLATCRLHLHYFRQKADFQWKSIPGGETNNGESETLPSCSSSTKYR